MERFTLLLLCLFSLHNTAVSTTRDTINTTQSLTDGETIVSAGGSFALGFFSPDNSKNRYLGIWYNRGPTMTVAWVANRNNPLTDSSGVLKVTDNGTLVLLNHNKSTIWSSNSSRLVQKPVTMLLDSGNLIVKDGSNNDLKDFLWQSFDYPCDTLLPGMKLGRNLSTGLNRYLTSWSSPGDPSKGNYTYQVDIDGYPQLCLRDGKAKRFRSGSWNGLRFSGSPQLKPNSIYKYYFVSKEEEIYYAFELVNSSVLSRLVLTADGMLKRYTWRDVKQGWAIYATVPMDDCDYYAKCGVYGSCNIDNSPPCSCLKGFEPRFPDEWNEADWSNGCVRSNPLSCHGDGFSKFSGLKLPDTQRSWFNMSMSLEDCEMLCMNNCSCTAYAGLNISEEASGCLVWFGELTDIRELSEPQQDIYVRMSKKDLDTTTGNKLKPKSNVWKLLIILFSTAGILILCLAFTLYRRKKYQKDRNIRGNPERNAYAIQEHHKEEPELPLFDTATLTSATNNFSTDNILGEVGFGSVYKDLITGRTIGVAKKQGGLYYLEIKTSSGSSQKLQHSCHQTSIKSCASQIWLHHKRLGHPPFTLLKFIFPTLFLNESVESFNCDICEFSKHH